MFYNNTTNKYFDVCVYDMRYIRDPYTYTNHTSPINISYLHAGRDLLEKYKYEAGYFLKNKFYQSYHSQFGTEIPNTNDMPILNEDGEYCYLKNGHHLILSINISASLNMPISDEYRAGILSLFIPDNI